MAGQQSRYTMTWWHGKVSHIRDHLGGGPPIASGLHKKVPVMMSFDVFFDVSMKKQLRFRWFETSWCSCNVTVMTCFRLGTSRMAENHWICSLRKQFVEWNHAFIKKLRLRFTAETQRAPQANIAYSNIWRWYISIDDYCTVPVYP